MLFSPLYLIVDPSLYKQKGSQRTFLEFIDEAIEGGVRWIQYRDKNASRREQFERAKQLQGLTRERNVVLIINDEIDLALAVKADGVHLGQDDFPVEMARKLLGEESIVGLSTHNLKQVKQAESENIDYIGIGPIFPTKTKRSQEMPLGIEGLAKLCAVTALPVYAIGGIQFSHLPNIISTRVTGLAIASALAGADQSEVQRWITCLDDGMPSV